MTKAFNKSLATAAMILLLAPSAALAQHRPGDAALGALSGAVVLGQVGAVAGAVVGYTAGPAIARSWGFDRRRSARQRRQASKEQASKEDVRRVRAEATGHQVENNARVANSRNEASGGTVPSVKPSAPTVNTTPPVQTLE